MLRRNAIVLFAPALLLGACTTQPSSVVTAAIEARYHLPASGKPFPQAALAQAIGTGVSVDSVRRALTPVADLIATAEWVTGTRSDGSPFKAALVVFRAPSGERYEVAFVFSDATLTDIDSREYLGTVDHASDSTLPKLDGTPCDINLEVQRSPR
jgi:hypothetical protein